MQAYFIKGKQTEKMNKKVCCFLVCFLKTFVGLNSIWLHRLAVQCWHTPELVQNSVQDRYQTNGSTLVPSLLHQQLPIRSSTIAQAMLRVVGGRSGHWGVRIQVINLICSHVGNELWGGGSARPGAPVSSTSAVVRHETSSVDRVLLYRVRSVPNSWNGRWFGSVQNNMVKEKPKQYCSDVINFLKEQRKNPQRTGLCSFTLLLYLLCFIPAFIPLVYFQ